MSDPLKDHPKRDTHTINPPPNPKQNQAEKLTQTTDTIQSNDPQHDDWVPFPPIIASPIFQSRQLTLQELLNPLPAATATSVATLNSTQNNQTSSSHHTATDQAPKTPAASDVPSTYEEVPRENLHTPVDGPQAQNPDQFFQDRPPAQKRSPKESERSSSPDVAREDFRELVRVYMAMRRYDQEKAWNEYKDAKGPFDDAKLE
ncbi:MAG: hypothetical protein Q9186_007500 [Xanthomendoza sp. 1 TL-2023]